MLLRKCRHVIYDITFTVTLHMFFYSLLFLSRKKMICPFFSDLIEGQCLGLKFYPLEWAFSLIFGFLDHVILFIVYDVVKQLFLSSTACFHCQLACW